MSSSPPMPFATVGCDEPLGSMHLRAESAARSGSGRKAAARRDLGLNKSSTYPSTEQTLSALSLVVNGGESGRSAISSANSIPCWTVGDQIHDLPGRL